MKRQLIAGVAALAFGIGTVMSAGAQSTATTQKPGERGATAAAAGEITVVGCVEFEQDYRTRMAAGRGGVLGTGLGANDEFVLNNARPADSSVGTSGSAAGREGQAGATGANAPSNSGAGGGVYTLTGDQEKNLKRDVGRQVEVVGRIENVGKRDTGADLTDISELPRIVITAWHPVGDFCPAR